MEFIPFPYPVSLSHASSLRGCSLQHTIHARHAPLACLFPNPWKFVALGAVCNMLWELSAETVLTMQSSPWRAPMEGLLGICMNLCFVCPTHQLSGTAASTALPRLEAIGLAHRMYSCLPSVQCSNQKWMWGTKYRTDMGQCASGHLARKLRASDTCHLPI